MTREQLIYWVNHALQQVGSGDVRKYLNEIKEILEDVDRVAFAPEEFTESIREKLREVIEASSVITIKAAISKDGTGVKYTPGSIYEMLDSSRQSSAEFISSLDRFKSVKIKPEQDVDAESEAGNTPPITPEIVAEQDLKYRITLEDLRHHVRRGDYQDRPAFSHAVRNDFFQYGEGGYEQFVKDYYMRSFMLNGQKHLGLFDSSEKLAQSMLSKVFEEHTEEEIRKQTASIIGIEFPEESDLLENFYSAHSQGPGSFIPMVLGLCVKEMAESRLGQSASDLSILIRQPEDISMEVKREDDKLYLTVVMDKFEMRDGVSAGRDHGVMDGRVEVHYLFANKNGRWGFQLIHVDTDNNDVIRALRGELLSSEELFLRHCSESRRNEIAAENAIAEVVEFVSDLDIDRLGRINYAADKIQLVASRFSDLILESAKKIAALGEHGQPLGADDMLPMMFDCLRRLPLHYPNVLRHDLSKKLQILLKAISDAEVPPEVNYYTTYFISAFDDLKYLSNEAPLKYTIDHEELQARKGYYQNNPNLRMFAERNFRVPVSDKVALTRDEVVNVNTSISDVIRRSLGKVNQIGNLRDVDELLTINPDVSNYSLDIRQFNDHDHLIVVYHDLPISLQRNDGNVQIGKLDGELRAEFRYVVDGDGKLALQLQSLQSENEEYLNIFRDQFLNRTELIKKYCDIDALRPEDLAYSEIKDLLNHKISVLRKSYPDSTLPDLAESVLREVENVKATAESNLAETKLSEVLLDTAKLIDKPTFACAKKYNELAVAVQKRPWGKMIGGAMMFLAGATMIALSVAAIGFTFGISIPTGASIAGILAGVAIAGGGIGLFKSGMQKKPLRSEMESLAKEAKDSKPRR